MDKNNDMMNFAMLMVDSATKNYLNGEPIEFLLVLTGIGKYGLESFPGAGHNYYMILEAIYKYYKEHPEKKVDKILFNSLMKFISAMSSTKALSLICNYIVAQIKNEEQGISPFKLDNIQLLKQLRFSVLNKAELLNNELATTLLDDTTKICEETMGKKVL